MRKMLVLITAAMVLSVSLAGCSQKPTNAPDTDSESVFVSEFSGNEPTESAAKETESSLLVGEESQAAKNSDWSTGKSNVTDTDSTPPKIESTAPQQTTSEKPAQRQETAQKPTPQPVTEQPKQETPASQPNLPPETEEPTTTMSHAPAILYSSIGTHQMVPLVPKTANPITPGLWKRWKTAEFTPLRAIPAIPAVKRIIPSVTMKSSATAHRHIKSRSPFLGAADT